MTGSTKAGRLGVCALLAAVVTSAAMAGTVVASVRSPARAPSCNRSASLPLNQSTGSAKSVLAPVLGAAFEVCGATPSAAVRAQLAAIKTLYRTNKSLAHKRLLALVAAVGTGRVHGAMRRTAATGCDGLDEKIHPNASSVPGLGDLIAAAQTAQLAGDTSGDGSALGAAGTIYARWAARSGATAVGDWFAIAQGAFALGDDAYGEQALANAQAAGIELEQTLTPTELGGSGSGSTAELTCLGQLDHVLTLFNPSLRCSQMPSGSVVSGIAGRAEVGPQGAAGVSSTMTGLSGGTAAPDLDCAYVDTVISQAQEQPFAGAEIQFDYEVPQHSLDFAVSQYGFGAWTPVSGVGTDAYGYTVTADDGTVLSTVIVWSHYTEITLGGFGSLGAYEAMANGLISSLHLG